MDSLSHGIALESRAFCARSGLYGPPQARVWVIHLLLLAIFGVLLPRSRGLDFLDPVLSTAYACLGLLFAAPAAAQAFSGERPAFMNQALSRILVAVGYGECMAVAMLLGGILTVSATHGGRILTPPLDTLGAALALGVSASLALASVAAWIALRFSAALARRAMRIIFLLILAGFFLKGQWLPSVAWWGVAICLAVSLVALVALRRLFP